MALVPPAIREPMGLAPGTRLWRITRLRLADDQIISLEVTWWPEPLGSWLLGQDLTAAFHVLLEEAYGTRLGSAVETITARRPTPSERKALELPPGVPVLAVVRITYDDQGQPSHGSTAAYRADHYSYRVTLRRDGRHAKAIPGVILGSGDAPEPRAAPLRASDGAGPVAPR